MAAFGRMLPLRFILILTAGFILFLRVGVAAAAAAAFSTSVDRCICRDGLSIPDINLNTSAAAQEDLLVRWSAGDFANV